jgi:prefoldin subunit 5
MSDARQRLEKLGARLDALTQKVEALGAESSPELKQSLGFLREQWDTLREDIEAVEMLGAGPGDAMMVTVEKSLGELEQASAQTEGRRELRRNE